MNAITDPATGPYTPLLVAPGAGATIELLPDPTPLIVNGGWRRWIGPLISLAMLVAVASQVSNLNWQGVATLLPASPLFWLLFAAQYVTLPTSEWIMFRRLWTLPRGAFFALIRKRISNEVLLGYSGEAYFYSWMRRNSELVGAPFGAIKDVTILSAAVGNGVTLVLLAASWSLMRVLQLGLTSRMLIVAMGVVALSSVATFVFRRTLFSLPRRELWFIAAMHLLRTVASTLFSAWMWHIVLPEVAFSWWLLLATLRMLVSRLPLVPNKDVVFAGLAVFLVGRDAQVSSLMTLMAGAIFMAHMVLGAVLGTTELVNIGRRQYA